MLYTFYSMLQRDLPDQLEKHVLRASETNTYKLIPQKSLTRGCVTVNILGDSLVPSNVYLDCKP